MGNTKFVSFYHPDRNEINRFVSNISKRGFAPDLGRHFCSIPPGSHDVMPCQMFSSVVSGQDVTHLAKLQQTHLDLSMLLAGTCHIHSIYYVRRPTREGRETCLTR